MSVALFIGDVNPGLRLFVPAVEAEPFEALNRRLDIEARCDRHDDRDEAEALGWELGFDGVEAELCTPHRDLRDAFETGHNEGDDHLWRVDPSWAAEVQARRDRAAEAVRRELREYRSRSAAV